MAMAMATQSLDILQKKWSRVREKQLIEVSRLYPDGYLILKEDPAAWIQRNPKDRLQLVRRLELYLDDDVEEIGDSIGELTHLTHFSIRQARSLKCLPNVITRLHYLQVLEIWFCYNLRELPASLGSLTHLTLFACKLLELLTSLGELHSLTHLTLFACELREIPASLGDLQTLTHLSLYWCDLLQELPSSLGELQTLTHFTLNRCDAVKSIPNMKVETLCFESGKDNHFPSFGTLSNLQTSILGVSQIPINSDGMPRLLFLDLMKSQIKHFSVLGNIKNLPELGILSLPKCFRLETLPFDLNDSLIISVDKTHVRKTWKELKIEMMWSFSDSLTASGLAQSPFNISPHECVLWNEAPIGLIIYESVRLLDLSICKDASERLASIKEMSQLTHLYIEGKEDFFDYIDLKYLPNTITRLKHLSLRGCDYKSFSDCLDMLTNLKSLELHYFGSKEAESIDISVLVSLRCLTLRHGHIKSLPNSMAKLSNLKTLVLNCCYRLESLPADMNLVKLKLIDTFIHSLPTGLRHLEILHLFDHDCYDFYDKNAYLKELVNLEILSITCYDTKFLPELEGLLNLQELQLKDCFNLRKMPKVGKLSKLCTLNISGTRIKTLPDCIRNSHNLQHLILPKCFKLKSLPPNFGKELTVTLDDIHEEYYKRMGFYDSDYETSSEDDNEITSDTEEVVDEEDTRISQEGHKTVQTSLHQLQNLPGDQTPVFGGHHSQGRNDAICEKSQFALHSLQNQQSKVNNNQQSDDSKVTTQKIDIPLEKIQSQMSKNITIVQAAKNLEVSRSTLKRRLKELQIKWPRNNKKICKDAKTTKDDVESSSRQCSSLFNLVNPINPRDQKLGVGINQLAALPNNVSFECPTTTQGNIQSNDIQLRAEVGLSSNRLKSTALYAPAIKTMTLDRFPYMNNLPPIMHPFLEGWLNVKADGNCGFRVVADAFHGGEDNWAHARRSMYNALGLDTIYERLYGGEQYVGEAMNRILWDNSVEKAPPEHWMRSMQDLFVIATFYNCVVIYFSFEATPAFHTILPLRALSGIQGPYGELGIAYCGTQRHYVRVFLSKHAPLPPVASYWHRVCDQSVRGWDENYAARLVFWEKTVNIMYI